MDPVTIPEAGIIVQKSLGEAELIRSHPPPPLPRSLFSFFFWRPRDWMGCIRDFNARSRFWVGLNIGEPTQNGGSPLGFNPKPTPKTGNTPPKKKKKSWTLLFSFIPPPPKRKSRTQASDPINRPIFRPRGPADQLGEGGAAEVPGAAQGAVQDLGGRHRLARGHGHSQRSPRRPVGLDPKRL